MFCGHLVVPYGEQPPPVDPSEIESDRMIRGRMQAQNHLEKLLEYDQNAVRRTTVYGMYPLFTFLSFTDHHSCSKR